MMDSKAAYVSAAAIMPILITRSWWLLLEMLLLGKRMGNVDLADLLWSSRSWVEKDARFCVWNRGSCVSSCPFVQAEVNNILQSSVIQEIIA